jgi:hypothetical protein
LHGGRLRQLVLQRGNFAPEGFILGHEFLDALGDRKQLGHSSLNLRLKSCKRLERRGPFQYGPFFLILLGVPRL